MDAHIAHIHIYKDEYIHLDSLNATEKKRFYLLYSNSSTHFVYLFFFVLLFQEYICLRLLSATIRYIPKQTWNLLPLFPFSVFSISAFRFIYPLIRCVLESFLHIAPFSNFIWYPHGFFMCILRFSRFIAQGKFFQEIFFHRFSLDFSDNKF